MAIKVDKDKCIGCGLCASIAPEIFEMDENGKSYVKNPKGKGNYKEAATSCPAGAISIK